MTSGICRTIGLTAALAWTAPAFAQAPPGPDLSIEELMGVNVERVFGASKRLQPVTDAPSSVTIITADEIAQHGYESLADILRGVRGFYVSYDRNYTYLGARGFSLPGDFNTRVLLLLDGHRLNDNIYDQAPIGPELGLDVLAIERVEVIRGPSASLYGTSAFFAVVNVITRTGAGLNGLQASVQTGSFNGKRASLAVGGVLSNGVDISVTASVEHSSGPSSLYLPEYDASDTNFGIVNGLDDERMASARGQVTFRNINIRGMYGFREKGVPTAPYGIVFNDERSRTTDERGFVDVQYQRTIGSVRLDARTAVDRYQYTGGYPYAPPGDADSILHDYATGTWWTAEARAARPIGSRHTLTTGGEYRWNAQQDQGSHYDDPGVPSTYIREHTHNAGVYVQDEVALSQKLIVNAGLRFDAYQGFSKLAPRAAVIFKPTPSRVFKYLYGQAFRAPNAYELYYYSAQNARDPLHAENIATSEGIWEEYIGTWLRTSVSGYLNHVTDLVRLDGPTAEDLFFVNQGHVDARGLELEAEVKMARGVHALGSYSLQDAHDDATHEHLTNSPRHVFKGRVASPVAFGVTGAVDVDHMSARRTLRGAAVDPATLVSVNLVRPVGRTLSLTLRLRNLFDRRYFDPGSGEHLMDAIEQNGRTFSVGVRVNLD